MRRLLVRLVVIAIVLGGGWVSYQLADYTKCNGPRVEQWATASLQRLEQSKTDMNSITEYTSLSQLDAMAVRAQARYVEQQAASAPSCLSTFQSNTSDALYYEWKAYEAAAAGNFDQAVQYIDKEAIARDSMEREYYILATKYGWDNLP